MRTRGLVGSGFAGLLVVPLAALAVEAAVASRRTYVDSGSAPMVAGLAGPVDGPAITLVVLGDSTGAGLGAATTEETVGGQLMAALTRSGWRVRLDGLAVSGAQVAGLERQVLKLESALLGDPVLGDPVLGDPVLGDPVLGDPVLGDPVLGDPVLGDPVRAGGVVVVVLIGVNDATHLTRLSAVEGGLRRHLSRLTSLGAPVVLATCPDIGAVRNFWQPLRWLAGWRGRAVAKAQERAAEGLPGVILVDLADTTGTAFRANPALLSFDLFHPSALGYALWARVLAPAVVRAASDATAGRA